MTLSDIDTGFVETYTLNGILLVRHFANLYLWAPYAICGTA
jgi:hypothetical protein